MDGQEKLLDYLGREVRRLPAKHSNERAVLIMLRECGIDKGQTIAIAVCKCIGTRTPTICGTPEGNRFIPVMDGICFVWDVIYIVELKR